VKERDRAGCSPVGRTDIGEMVAGARASCCDGALATGCRRGLTGWRGGCHVSSSVPGAWRRVGALGTDLRRAPVNRTWIDEGSLQAASAWLQELLVDEPARAQVFCSGGADADDVQ
jgi:hypothetical protein